MTRMRLLRHAATGIACLLIAGSRPSASPASARPLRQAPRVLWGEPQVAWQTAGTIVGQRLVTDAAQRTHLLILESTGDGATLYHALVTDGPLTPTDILVGQYSEFRATADASGSLHVLLHGVGNSLLLTSAPADKAGSASAWSPVVQIEEAPIGSDLSADGQDRLHLCFANGQDLKHSLSEDGGLRWSESNIVAQMREADGIAVEERCVADSEGILHAAWSEVTPPDYYPSLGVWYSRSLDDGQTWDAPLEMAGEHYTLPSFLADGQGRLHLIWQGDVAVGGRYYRQRSAGPEGAWSPTETLLAAGEGGMSGIAGMALDSLDRLHAVIAVDKGSVWTARSSTWLAPVLLTGSLNALPNESGSIGEGPTLALSQGNELTAAFAFDRKRVYTIQGQADSPPATALPIPTGRGAGSAANATATALAAVQVLSTVRHTRPTPSPTLDTKGLTRDVNLNDSAAVEYGILAALLLVGIAMRYAYAWRRQRR